jgi:hypothetical protein
MSASARSRTARSAAEKTIGKKYKDIYDTLIPEIGKFRIELDERRKKPYHKQGLFGIGKKTPKNIQNSNKGEMSRCFAEYDNKMKLADLTYRDFIKNERNANETIIRAEFKKKLLQYTEELHEAFRVLSKISGSCMEKFPRVKKLLTRSFKDIEGYESTFDNFLELKSRIYGVREQITLGFEAAKVVKKAEAAAAAEEVHRLPDPPKHSPSARSRGGGRTRRKGRKAH